MEDRDGGPRDRRSAYLPSGYHLNETDPDELVLRCADGSEVAVFSGGGRSEGDRGEGLGGI
jgi:hypothetical protein